MASAITNFSLDSAPTRTVLLVDANGVPYALPGTNGASAPTQAAFNAFAQGDNVVAPASASGRIKVYSYVAVAAGAVTVAWKSGASFISGTMAWAANSGVSVNNPIGSPVLIAATSATLSINLSATIAVGGHIAYIIEE